MRDPSGAVVITSPDGDVSLEPGSVRIETGAEKRSAGGIQTAGFSLAGVYVCYCDSCVSNRCTGCECQWEPHDRR